MRCSCAMTVLSVTPPTNEEGENVEGVEEAKGVAVSVYGRFNQSWASLRVTVATFMAHITKKCVDFR